MPDQPYLEQLEINLRQQASSDAIEQVTQFARECWQGVVAEDLAGRSIPDDASLTIESWRLFAGRTGDEIAIQVANPNHGRNGWHSPHTIVVVAARNMPFMVDSILMALSHDGVVTHFLNNVVMCVDRDDNGQVTNLSPDAPGETRELLLVAEVDRLPDAQIPQLEARLQSTATDLQAAVTDFPLMKERLRQVAAELDPSVEDAPEAGAFLDWLMSDRFTFLGYREFDYQDDTIKQVGDALGVLRVRKPASVRQLSAQPDSTREFLLEPSTLSFSKGGRKSLVHRPAYPDYVAIKKFDSDGNVIGEHGFLGLYTSPVYMESPEAIPVLRRKVRHVIDNSGFATDGFDGKVLRQVLATYPRDELFQIAPDQLAEQSVAITNFHERRKIKLFVRRDRYGLFVNTLVYLPRDLFDTNTRLRIEQLLIDAFGAEDTQYDIHLSESILVRLQFILRINPADNRQVDVAELERAVTQIANDWRADLDTSLTEVFGETRGRELLLRYEHAFSAGYREYYTADVAVADIECIEALADEWTLNTRLYRLVQDNPETLRLKVFHAGNPLPLSDQVPKLENLGFRITEEKTYRVERRTVGRVTIHDFKLQYDTSLDLVAIATLFNESFGAIWLGQAEDDTFNRLILASSLSWQQVSVLRVYARYLRQIRFGFSQGFISNTLFKHRAISELLVGLFESRMSPSGDTGQENNFAEAINEALDGVSLLNEDRVLRRLFEVIMATDRTNYFQRTEDGKPKAYLSLKLNPAAINNMPLPRPQHEIFVCSPTFEGVHLRGGEIARGGLRWSDRFEDYRTEVLGLMKAQVVKNGVIVPTGAKGGFIVRGDADVLQVYRSFISGLLDLTDNRVGSELVPPADTRCHDAPDPYLVVAADKGTATFSDHANAVAEEYGFWLQDGFASGGSNGYDHKKMGITARGAWVSVQRHFRERGIDVQKDQITVIGIGDMGGDVFGNGMLQSEAIALVGAFNHRHIFLDPDPDTAASFTERTRLFNLPRSGWNDYDTSLISEGGGIFSRDAKSITVTPQIQALLGISDTRLTPDELINRMLKAPVDLLWNGGIGTYVKAAGETHDAVGDRANDHIRVDANELRVSAFGEGGNLGLTQSARIEFAMKGGLINTDAIDNSAGVNCSDREVNIKILLNKLVADGDLTTKQRNTQLESLTDEVAGIVLDDNQSQTRCISLAAKPAPGKASDYLRFMHRMEAEAALDRELEVLPSDDTLMSRSHLQSHLTRPELSVLLAYAKIHVKNHLVLSGIADEPLAMQEALRAFPPSLRQSHHDAITSHSLKNEIVASQLANTIVDLMGITFVAHHMDFVGGSVEEVASAFLIFANIFDVREWIEEIDDLTDVPEEIKQDSLLEIMRLGRHCTRWLLRHKRSVPDATEFVDNHKPIVATLVASREAAMSTLQSDDWKVTVDVLVSAGMPETLARRSAAASRLADVFPIIDIADETGALPMDVAEDYVELAQSLNIDALVRDVAELPTASHWQIMERNALVDSIKVMQGTLAASAIHTEGGNVSAWLSRHAQFTAEWQAIVSEAFASAEQDLSLYSITCRKLQDLCNRTG